MAGRSYGNFSFLVFWRKVPRIFPYVPAETTDQSYGNGDGTKETYDEPYLRHGLVFDPYESYERTEYPPLPEPGIPTTMSPPAEAPSFDLQSLPQGHTRASGTRPRYMRKQLSSESAMQPLMSR